MSSVVNINRLDQSRFEKFAEESSHAFEEFMVKGHAYTPIKAYIYSYDINNVVSTDVRGTKYPNSLNVINYYNPSFRSALPNMDGALHSSSQTYGLFFMSFITGFYNVEIYKFFGEGTKIIVDVERMMGGSNNNSLLTIESYSRFLNAHIIGFSKDPNIVNVAVRYSEHTFEHYHLKDDKSSKGRTSAGVNYTHMKG